MEVNIQGDPGRSNQYQDTHVGRVDSLNPNAQQVIHYHNYAPHTNHRLIQWFRDLKEEAAQDKRLQTIRDDIKAYHTKLPRTIGLRRKLLDGGFGEQSYAEARRQKQRYMKKAMQFQYYEAAQCIEGYLLPKIKARFDSYVMPLVGHADKAEVKQAVLERVVTPIMDEIDEYATDDENLRYNVDDIYGMLYMLTGNCHINWCDYDDAPAKPDAP